MPKDVSRAKQHPVWAAVLTVLAAAMWGMLGVLTVIAYIRGDLKPASTYPASLASAYALTLVAVTIATWLVTPRPVDKKAASAFGVARMFVAAVLVVAAIGFVFDLGPNPRPQSVTLLSVFDAFISGTLAIGLPFTINLVRPARRKRTKL